MIICFFIKNKSYNFGTLKILKINSYENIKVCGFDINRVSNKQLS